MKNSGKSFLVSFFSNIIGLAYLKLLNDLTREGQQLNWTTSGVMFCKHAFEAEEETSGTV